MKFLVLLLVSLLTACGGGDYEDDEKSAGKPDCEARPELCR